MWFEWNKELQLPSGSNIFSQLKCLSSQHMLSRITNQCKNYCVIARLSRNKSQISFRSQPVILKKLSINLKDRKESQIVLIRMFWIKATPGLRITITKTTTKSEYVQLLLAYMVRIQDHILLILAEKFIQYNVLEGSIS